MVAAVYWQDPIWGRLVRLPVLEEPVPTPLEADGVMVVMVVGGVVVVVAVFRARSDWACRVAGRSD